MTPAEDHLLLHHWRTAEASTHARHRAEVPPRARGPGRPRRAIAHLFARISAWLAGEPVVALRRGGAYPLFPMPPPRRLDPPISTEGGSSALQQHASAAEDPAVRDDVVALCRFLPPTSALVWISDDEPLIR